ncbi:MAG: hypothetical protein ACLUD2_20660 [Clostridium sp.]
MTAAADAAAAGYVWKTSTFKTGGVDGCDCDAILKLIGEGKIDTTPRDHAHLSVGEN